MKDEGEGSKESAVLFKFFESNFFKHAMYNSQMSDVEITCVHLNLINII